MKEKAWRDIFEDIKKKIYAPVYFLMGEEPFFIDVIADQIEMRVLDDMEKEFNFSVLYGREVDVPAVVSTAKRFPMMANHQVVIVKEAQNMKDIESLESYIKNPLKSTLLVICYKYKTIDKRKSLYKTLLKEAVVMDSKKLKDYEMPGWISNYIKNSGYRIGNKASQLLADHLGNDLGKVVNELKKVFISLPKGNEVTTDTIEQNIGISKDFNVFELQNALTEKNSLKAYQIARYFADNPKSNPLVVTMAVLHSYFVKILLYHSLKDRSDGNVAKELGMNPFFVKDVKAAAANYSMSNVTQIMSLLRAYDLKSKGVDNPNTDHGELLRELTYRIMFN